MGIDQHDYPLGYSEDEARRLAAQAALFEDLTEDMLRRADLHAGMQVLDVGCGVGDVSLLAARMVGSSGVVLGIDRAAPLVQTARLRTTAAGATSARFEEAELETFVAAQKFDAIIGRLVLMYLPDPAAVLRRLPALPAARWDHGVSGDRYLAGFTSAGLHVIRERDGLD